MNYVCENLKTSDNVKIACNLFSDNRDTVIIIAHGWFMSKNSKAFLQISDDLAKFYDVISFDFRGHCDSSGLYTFGAEETKDLEAVVNFASKKYKTIYLMGFSLGSLISINYCALSNKIDKLIVVSAPVNFDKIENNVFSPNAFIPTLKKFELKRWTSIRFKLPFAKKPEPINLVDKINIPIFFIAGEKDPIIKQWHNSALYEHANNPKKILVFKNGKHAEDIYLENKELFIKCCVDWLNYKEQYVGV